MPRHPKQSEYERNAANRHALRIQAAMFGWTKLDALDTFLTSEGEIIVIDKELNRYAATAEATKLLAPVEAQAAIVAPADTSTGEIGPRWQKLLPAIHKVTAPGGTLDLTTRNRGEVLSNLEQLAASVLRVVEALRAHTGPDWREAIGIIEDDS